MTTVNVRYMVHDVDAAAVLDVIELFQPR